MRNNISLYIYLFVGILLSGCASTAPTPTATLPAEISAIQTNTVATVRAQITQTAAVRSPTPTPKPNVFQTRVAKITPPAIVFATLEPAQLPAMLQNALSVKAMEPFNGHRLRRITGWQYGFTGFEWMDQNYLLVHPVVGWQSNNHGGYQLVGRPVVMRLDKNTIWFPSSYSVLYSSLVGRLISTEKTDSGDVIHTYNPKGDLLKTYQGNILGISPSGSKILIAENASGATNGKIKWVDLKKNKEVMFTWETTLIRSHPCCGVIWSPDEMSVLYPSDYGGNFYGNAKNGESYLVPYPYINYDEENLDHLIEPPQHFLGAWVLNDTYLLTRWYEVYVGTPGYLSVFDPAKQSYRNLSALVGLPSVHELYSGSPSPYPCENGQPSAAPGGRYVWVNCLDGGELIDMQTFKTQSYPRYPETELKWSADGNFAFLNYSDQGNKTWQQILSAATNQVTEMPIDAEDITWHPTQNIFAYLSKSRRTLTIFNAEQAAIQKQVDLPVAIRYFDWNTRGDKMLLVVEDKSLWQIDTPTLGNLDQLTSPIAGAHNATWSPDSSSIAFQVENDIYIVDVKRTP